MDNWKCVRMEDFGSRDSAPDTYCRDAIAKCEVAVFIVGHRYGSCPADSKQSFTEHEYDAALDSDRPRLVFLAPDDFAVPVSEIEDDERRDRQSKFRQRVLTDRVSVVFNNPDDLGDTSCDLNPQLGGESWPTTRGGPTPLKKSIRET